MMILLMLAVNAILVLALLRSRRRHRHWGKALDALLLRLVPGFLLPGGRPYEKAVAYVHGAGGYEPYLETSRRQTARWCFYIWIVLSLAVCGVGAEGLLSEQSLHAIERPEHGSGNKRIRMEAEVLYNGAMVRHDVDLVIREKTLSDREIGGMLDLLVSTLPSAILGKNEDLGNVRQDLMLPSHDPSGTIRIRWKSSRPDIITPSGVVIVEKLDRPVCVLLTAELEWGRVTRAVRIPVSVAMPRNEKEVQIEIAARIDRLAEQIRRTTGGDVAILPASCGDGFDINWRHKNDSTAACFATGLAGIALIRFIQHRRAIGAAVGRRKALEREFPDFLFKLALLLNAGLVAPSAIDRIAEEHIKSGRGNRRPLFEEITGISRRVHQTNSPIEREMRLFAERSGIREIMRFSMILHDNLNKGSRLEEAIAAEGTLLWDQRKKHAEERGRTADTKMSLPLMILLLSLVVTTVAPALITMD